MDWEQEKRKKKKEMENESLQLNVAASGISSQPRRAAMGSATTFHYPT